MSEYESFLKGLVEAETTIFTQPPKIEGVECPVCHEGVLILKKVVKAHSGDVALMLKMDVKLFSLMLMVNLLFMNVLIVIRDF